jgi:hypothetical protein
MTHDFSNRGLYDIYRIEIQFRDKLVGGVPKNKDLLADAVRAHTGFDDEKTQEQIKELGSGVVDVIVEKSWNGFALDDVGLYIKAFQVKALFKECAQMLRLAKDRLGSKQILQHGFEVKALDGSDKLHLGKSKPDGTAEGPIHVMTPQGPRTAIKKVDYVEKIALSFEVWVLATHHGETRHVGEEQIVQMLRFGQENGVGADRSQGAGKFDVKSFEVVQKSPPATAVLDKPEKPAKKPAKKDEDKKSEDKPS